MNTFLCWLILAVLLLWSAMATVKVELGQGENLTIHGTLNIILANQNGFVVATDSMQTQWTSSGDKQIPEPAQKLFPVDDHSVCTIAGFGSATVAAAPEFNTNSAGIIGAYMSEQLRQKAPQNFQAKLTSLSFLFGFYLSSLADLRQSIGLPLGDYSLQLLLAGYDSDGTPKLGALVLRPVVSTAVSGRPFIRMAPENIFERAVGKEVTILVGGQRDVAAEILDDPKKFASARPVRRYLEALAADRGSSLTIEEMKQFAEFVVARTAERYPSVGGPLQVAIIQNGHIVSLKQPNFTSPPTPIGFNLFVGGHIAGAHRFEIKIQGATFLWLQNQFIDDPEFSIDGHYFFGNEIIRCRVHYDGGFTRFDPSNQVVDSVLVIGKHANFKSDLVYRLVHNFDWREVVYEKR